MAGARRSGMAGRHDENLCISSSENFESSPMKTSRNAAVAAVWAAPAAAAAACWPVPTLWWLLSPLVTWRRRTTWWLLPRERHVQQRRQPGAASPALRSSDAGRSGELARSLGKPQGVLEVKDGRQVGAGSWLRADGHRKGCWFACFRSLVVISQCRRVYSVVSPCSVRSRQAGCSVVVSWSVSGKSHVSAHARIGTKMPALEAHGCAVPMRQLFTNFQCVLHKAPQ